MMPIESLSSFAISVAANIVSSLFARNSTEKDIREAFQEAIEKWCPNEDIRRFREADIASFVRGYIQNPSFDEEDLSGEMKDFLRCFEESVASHPAAFHYLSAIKGKVYYNEVMTALQIVNTKLDAISRKIDEADPRHSDLHFEAVIQINTVLEISVVDYVNVFLYGILAAFDDDIYAYIDSISDQKIPVVIDRGSLLKEVDGDYIRPKFQDIDYDWDKEENHDWCQLNPNLDFGELFSRSYIAGFQMMGIDFFESIESLNETIDRKTINDQLSKEEKRLLTEIEVSLRAVQSMLDDHSDIICKLDGVQFENLKVLQERSFKDKGVKLGLFRIMYEKDGYQEEISRFVAPEKAKDNLLAVFLINPEYYFKMSGYLGELLNLVREWWQVSGNFFLECPAEPLLDVE